MTEVWSDVWDVAFYLLVWAGSVFLGLILTEIMTRDDA